MTAPSLVGRDHELAELDAFLDDALSTGAALLLPGEAGVGKSALLRAAARRAAARGARVIEASGVQFEAELSFGTLHQLLRPILSGLDALPRSSATAFRSALGIARVDSAVEPLVVYHAAWALLADAAKREPILVLVDDLHWVDAASAAALAFLARRLEGLPIGFLGTVRVGEPSHFDVTGMRTGGVHPLSPADADALVRDRNPHLPATLRQRLVQRSAGFPLALVEWTDDLEPLASAEPGVLPLPTSLERSFGARIERLPPRTREALLMLALDGRTGLHDLRVLEGRLDDLAPAEAVGAIAIDDEARRVEFRHPLFRSALVAGSTSAERRRIHARLADSHPDDRDRRTWHLAAAAAAPDETVAVLLDELAHRSLARGDAQGAFSSLARAALLSPAAADRARRLAEAAYLGADIAGDLERARQLLGDASADLGHGPGSLYAVIANVQVIANSEGAHLSAVRQIEQAVLAGSHGWRADDAELIATFRTWLLLCSYAGDPSSWERYFEALDRLVPEAPRALRAESWAVGDTMRRGADARAVVLDLSTRPAPRDDPAVPMSMIFAASYLDEIDAWRSFAWDCVLAGRQGGSPRPYARCLSYLSVDDFLHGRWADAQLLADEGALVCEQNDFGNGAWYFAYLQALLAAGRGEIERSRERAAFADVECARRESWGAQRFSYQPRALAAVADGDWEGAYRAASRLGAPGAFSRHVPPAMWVAFDLVEAAMHTGRRDEARAHSRAMAEAGIPRVSSRLALLTAGATAVAASDDAWVDRFEAALATPEAATWPFDLARIQLAYGERLRRAVNTSRAREVLHDALEVFDRVGATPWSERASNELRATGDPRSRPAAVRPGLAELTPQERVIAEMAASGMTNKQIGERLFLSPRTVSGHLYNTFPKLRIASRAGLRDALARDVE